MRKGLDKLGVPHKDEGQRDFRKIPELYDAIDLYIITSREEGGPKACLESMAKGVSLVTTEVGQAKDLVTNRENAMMTPIGDIEALTTSAIEVLNNSNLRENLIKNGYKTALENSFESQLPLWKEYLKPLID